MGSYVPSTAQERQEMLASVGLCSIDELFSHIPDSLKRKGELNLPSGKSELEVCRTMEHIAAQNIVFDSIFRGAGAYDHYIPAIVKSVTGKEEFVTAYTPYQAEISQGVLQSIFEYQTMICELAGMDVSNASVYDGSNAAADPGGGAGGKNQRQRHCQYPFFLHCAPSPLILPSRISTVLSAYAAIPGS